METLNFRFENGSRQIAPPPQLVGVVSSGNLEILIEPAPLGGACEVEVKTAAIGFGATWGAVIADFHARWLLADTRISINDMGATPAVVSLRLDQAAESVTGHGAGAGT
jgi:malonate decarboxylase delta subunit